MSKIGCTTVITTLTPEKEIERVHLSNKSESKYGLFGWLPTVLTEESTRQRTAWMLQKPSGGGPLDIHQDAPVVSLESTFTFLIYLKGDYLPPCVYKTIAALLEQEKRDVYLIKSSPFTLNQTPIIQEIYHLSLVDDFSYLSFEEVDASSVVVHIHKEPELIEEEPPDLVAEMKEPPPSGSAF